ncbi:hypothetical protein A8709_21795 [Paenibacillus pectinilyticus]|uniref:Beta-galactosidase n=1 Tax=Paenibacillus pectinilyticus TaxID=512399 RepID=A0A1C0ZXZ7_9BACL|nr:beta-galactosidase [Paenibacillus pectinilyticus]OCT12958.1 hypothetical protein A8709_21795 [Paenibacillus pectinilyticus]
MYFGVDYYPEHWPEERWTLDARMMREAGMNIVRLAEFAWVKMEPELGVYDFSWLDRAIEVLASEGIQIILGTPTAAAPKWLMDLHPDMYPVDVYGLKKGFGTRRHYCPNHAVYIEHSKRIARKMAEHYADNPHVVAWQVDNEFGGPCYCQSDLREFRKWLNRKYDTIEALNREWGTIFWSQTYRHFDEIDLPAYSSSDGFSQNAGAGDLSTPHNHNPGMLLDYHRFFTDATVAYQKAQIDEIRAYTALPITHNLMGHASDLDYFKLGKDLDFICWDNYPNNMWGKASPSSASMAHDLMRGIKEQNFWMMEQQSGPCGWQHMGDTPEPGQLRLWTYQALAHGAEAMVYFRWRACTVGIEQYWHGILDHDGIGRRRYREIKQLGAELAGLNDVFVDSQNVSPIAVIKSYDNYWSHRQQPHNRKFSYGMLLNAYYDAIADQHINLDVTSVETDFAKYKMVMMPAFNLMTAEISAKCEAYVAGGGALLITFRSGTKTWNNQMSTLTVPGHFREMAGVELEEFDSINFGRTVKVKAEFGEGTAAIWADVLNSNGAEVLATYDSHYYAGQPAVTVNRYGEGHVYYVGCDLDAVALGELMKLVAQREGLVPLLREPVSGVEIIAKTKDGQPFWVLLNYTNEGKRFEIPGDHVSLLDGSSVGGLITLAPYGVMVIRQQ